MSDENALRLEWSDFDPADDRQAMALALLTAGIVVDTDEAGNELPGDAVRLDFRTADMVLDALRSSGRRLTRDDALAARVLWPASANWSSGKRQVIAELQPVKDGLCAGCGTKPTRETGSCRCLHKIADRLGAGR